MSTDAPSPPAVLRGMIYPLQAAIARNQHIAVAAHLAVDGAMRRLHDMPNTTEYLKGKVDPDVADDIVAIFRAQSAARFHERYRTDESRCRWCGIAAAEARAELEAEDADEAT